jgi:DNA-binding GntR family transcriptional regulator
MKEMDSQSKPSLKLQAYQYLKTKILNCEYRPNEFLNEQKLCAEMGNISRTPMRDALGRLEQEGLITILPKKGLMVSGITEEDVHSMFEMRLLVEPYALRTYGNLIPREQLEAYTELMHHPERIDDFCKSDDLGALLTMTKENGRVQIYVPTEQSGDGYDRITGLNTRFRIMTGKVSMINQDQTCEEHLEILNAALSDNWNTAADALQHHLELARDKAEGVIKVIRLW